MLYCSLPHAVRTAAGAGCDEVHRPKACTRNQQRTERVQLFSHDESRQLKQQQVGGHHKHLLNCSARNRWQRSISS